MCKSESLLATFVRLTGFSNLIPLTIAPALLTAGIYLCLGRVITVVGSENSRLKPKWYTYIFVGCDLLSLVLQAIGGGMAATGKDAKASRKGADVMIGGLICQVISMAFFLVVWGDFALRARRAKTSGSLSRTQPPLYDSLRATRTFHWFQWSKLQFHLFFLMIELTTSKGLFFATILIFIRCIYRVAELWDGFSGHLANDEATFMIFEGPMIILAVTAMTVFHPGRVFGDLWVPAGKGVREMKLESGDQATRLTAADEWKTGTTNIAYQRV